MTLYNEDAERELCAALKLDAGQFYRVADLDAEALYFQKWRLVFQAIKARVQTSRPVNDVALAADLRGKIEARDIYNLNASTLHVESLAGIITDMAQRRRLLDYAGQLSRIAHNHETSTDEAAQVAAGILTHKTRGTLRHAAEVTDAALEEAQRWEHEPLGGVSTGLHDLDDLTSGLIPGFYIVAGRTSMGKTALALAVAANVARQKRVLYLTFEMRAEQIMHRLASSLARVELRALYQQRVNTADRARFLAELDKLRYLKLDFYDDSPKLSRVISLLHTEHGREPLGLVVVDNMGHIDSPGNGEYEAMHATALALKQAQNRLGVVLMGLHQLSRDVEKRTNKRPVISDLRNAGEEDAGRIWLLYRDEYYNPNSDKRGILEVAQVKDRLAGSIGTRDLYFGKFSEVRDVARQQASRR